MSDRPSQKDEDNQDRDALAKRARALFEQGVANLDGRTRSELTQARHRALAAIRAPGARWRHGWLSAGGFATAALAAWMVLNLRAPEPANTVAAVAVDDMEILASADNLDLLEEMDFYSWLDTEQDARLSGGAG